MSSKNESKKVEKKVEQKISKAVAQLSVVPRKRKAAKSKKSKVKKLAKLSGQGVVSRYAQTLNDPFDNAGVQMGFGCLIPTGLNTVYVRGQVTVGTDGSFQIGALPYVTNTTNQGCISGSSNAAYGTAPTYAYVASANNASFLATANFARVVSGGVRAFVRFPQTSQAGVMYTSSVATNSSVLTSNSIQTMQTWPQTQLCTGHSAMVLYRPTDYNDLEFYQTSANTAAISLASWQGFIFGTGYPTGAIAYYEAIFHLESYATTATSSAEGTDQEFLSNIFGNVETAIRTVKQSLTPEQVDLAGEFGYSLLSRGLGAAVGMVSGMTGSSSMLSALSSQQTGQLHLEL